MFLRPLILLQRLCNFSLFIVDSGCTMHMTAISCCCVNFVEKFLGTVRFEMDQCAPILLWETIYSLVIVDKISTLFLFKKSTSSTRSVSWLNLHLSSMVYWIDRLSHLNFDYITLLSKKDIVTGLPKLTYVKDQLCSSCEMSKAKRSSFKSKAVPSSKKAEILLTWTLVTTPEVLKTFSLDDSTPNLQAHTSTLRTPEQNGVVERRNRTLVEAARTMLSASKLPLSFWAEAVATACYTQNRSIIISTHGKTGHIPILMTENFNKIFTSLAIVPLGTKRRQIMENSDPIIQSNTTGLAEENNNDQAPNASVHQDDFFNPFCTRVQEIGESSVQEIEQEVDEDQTVIRNKAQLVAKGYAQEEEGSVDQIFQEKSTLRKALVWIKQAPKSWNSDHQSPKGILIIRPSSFRNSEKHIWIMSLLGKATSGGGYSSLGDKLVSWTSKKQHCTSNVFREAEYVGLSEVVLSMWMRTTAFTFMLQIQQNYVVLRISVAIAISCNPYNIHGQSNIHTPPFLEERFKYLVSRIGMRCLTLAELEVLANETA
ncbi:retrovirus-related pol polyprotein from transposon TNT 1-94 [Tanacetum coccineum]